MTPEQIANARAGRKNTMGTVWYHRNDHCTERWVEMYYRIGEEFYLIRFPTISSLYNFLVNAR